MTISFLGVPIAALLVCGIMAGICVLGIVGTLLGRFLTRKSRINKKQKKVEVKMTRLLDDLTKQSEKIEALEKEDVKGFFKNRKQVTKIKNLKQVTNQGTATLFLKLGKKNEKLIDAQNKFISKSKKKNTEEYKQFDPVLKKIYFNLQEVKKKDRYVCRWSGDKADKYTPPVKKRKKAAVDEPTLIA